jgi:hypothetical protein
MAAMATAAAALPMTHCALPVIMGTPPVLAFELLELPGALLDPELKVLPLPLLELTTVCRLPR